ncbi:hypothetical protein G9C85_02340 [Halorubellus sp. JP-L1]|uniref:hypothetical protein n=1 Tax=Halorubellus sp. JP-L1 TaxID=2715753 RepID=UPI00140A71E7|nr:hypothetical protein [Halorubellus sp. JP-L1]NHN40476.1 hypothetical protein [Halorubellus sp. JP-L1]
MPSSRRAVTVGLGIALAGCASFGRATDRAASESTTRPATASDRSRRRSGSNEPPEWWRSPPDLVVVNDGPGSATAYLAVFGPHRVLPRFRETVSLRAAVAGQPAARWSFEDVDLASARGVLSVETADGREGRTNWHGGGPRDGIGVHLHTAGVDFVSLAR